VVSQSSRNSTALPVNKRRTASTEFYPIPRLRCSIVLFHHESTLRLMLEALGLDENHWPGGAKNAPSMSEFFLGSR
jgi:hypothetical protein